MRLLPTLLLICCVLSACKNGDAGADGIDTSHFTSSAGQVALSDGGSLEFSITSDQYKQWYKAQQSLEKRVKSKFGALLQPASPSERSISRAVEYLESEPAARNAIQRAGLSVRAFVVTTVALEQEMRVASESATPRPDTMAMPLPPQYPYPVDPSYPSPYPTPVTTPYPPAYTAPYPAVPAYPPPLPERRDSIPRVDTVFVPVPMRDTTPRPDTLGPRRDSVLPKRDTSSVWRDSVASRRDTLARPRLPRDTLPRDTLGAVSPQQARPR